MKIIKEINPNLLSQYKRIQVDQTYWDILENEINDYCRDKKINYQIEFHHGGFSKS